MSFKPTGGGMQLLGKEIDSLLSVLVPFGIRDRLPALKLDHKLENIEELVENIEDLVEKTEDE